MQLFDDVASTFAERGARRAFAVPSVHNLKLLEALAGRDFDIVGARSELGAAHMADGHARVADELTLVVTSTGPGAGNAVGAFATAVKDGSPVVHVSTSNDLSPRQGLHHVPEQAAWMGAMGKPVVDLAIQGIDALDMALRNRAATGVLVPISGQSLQPQQPVTFAQPFTEPIVLLEDALAAWLNAERRVLLIGGGARAAGTPALVSLAEASGAAVITTIQGKDLFPNNHPQFVGCTFSSPDTRSALADAEACLALGSRFTQTSTAGWSGPATPTIVNVNIAPTDLLLPATTVIDIVRPAEDVAPVAEKLATERGEAPRYGTEAVLRRNAARARRDRSGFEYEVLQAIESALSARDVLVCDMTKLTFWSLLALELPDQVRQLFPGLLNMGFGLPAAIGACWAAPDAHVIAIVGDGGLATIMQELDLCREHPGRLTVVLADDDGYYLLHPSMEPALARQLCQFSGPDWRLLSEAVDVPFFDVATPAELADVLGHEHVGTRLVRIDARPIRHSWRDA